MTEPLPEHIRAFISIPPSPPVERELQRFQREVEMALPPNMIRWAHADQLHLTVKFLGNIPGAQVPELSSGLQAACSQHTRLLLRPAGLGCFPNARNPRVIWVGLEGDVAALERLYESINDVAGPWAEKEERRAFSPHLTLGRVREPAPRPTRQLGEQLQSMAVPAFSEWPVEQVNLMRSQLSAHGATHTLLAACPLRFDS